MSERVRRATVEDAADLAWLAAVTFPLACPPGSTRADQQAFIDAVLSVERFTEYLADPARVLLVAHDDAEPEPIGYTMLVEGEPADVEVRAAITLRPTVELSKCYVLPGHHGQGVSAALMAATLDAARRTGARGMWLGVNQLNERAQGFYRRSGFVRVGTKHFQVGNRLEDDFVLELTL
ncbi:GNAT family N-acetyltransferase [Cellulomonas sp. WB94]|uniref:GNAT family N-acetyltransferase n=1 Tax=Cellulomonas sp. WB94 TaxID=2173174 RepID=UPI000D57CB02|nr:GNAT family N-acetyltransferase [Cellulomonas sp. WB94]PVU82482.1 GNAT family N-acetyltransferase [Cellulomonas sp. WB94]